MRELRKHRGLQQAQLAEALGLAQTTIGNYEQHTRFPDERNLNKIADYFEVSLDYLLGRSDSTLTADRILTFRAHDAPGRTTLSRSAGEYLNRLLNGQQQQAFESVISSIVEGGMSVREVYREILEPALKAVGSMWETNEIDVYDEHFVSHATESLMGQLRSFLVSGPPTKGTVILAPVPGELHDIGLRMVSDFVEAEGFRCVFLGANTPTGGIAKALIEKKADILAISATLTFDVDAVADALRRVRSAASRRGRKHLRIVAGGQAFTFDRTLWERVGADGFAANAEEAVQVIASFAPDAREHRRDGRAT